MHAASPPPSAGAASYVLRELAVPVQAREPDLAQEIAQYLRLKKSRIRSVRILGVRVDDVTMDETLDLIAAMIAAGGPHQIATVNPEFVMAAQRNRAFRATLEAATLAVPDGTGLMYAARWQGRPLRAKVTGIDLTERLAAASAAAGRRLFLLGAAPGVAERAAAALEERYPGVRIAGTWAGSPRPADQLPRSLPSG